MKLKKKTLAVTVHSYRLLALTAVVTPALWTTVAFADDLYVSAGHGGNAVTSTGSGSTPFVSVDGLGADAAAVDDAASAAASGGNGAYAGNIVGAQSQGGIADAPGGYAASSAGGSANNSLGFGSAEDGGTGDAPNISAAHGGVGGNVDISYTGVQSFGTLNLEAGHGGNASGVNAQGGNGGNITINANDHITIDNALHMAGGNAGAVQNSSRVSADQSGTGGQGGNVSLTVQGNFTTSNTALIELTGGSGGAAAFSNQAANHGGAVSMSVNGDMQANQIVISGSAGGAASTLVGGTGGNAGDVNIHVGQSAVISNLSMQSGTTGTGTANAQGGNGSNVTMTVNGTLQATTLNLNALYDALSPSDGMDGNVRLNAGTLITDNAIFSQAANTSSEWGNNLYVNVGTLLLEPGQSTYLHFYENNPNHVVFDTILLNSNSNLMVDNHNGGFSFNTLHVAGTNAMYQDVTNDPLNASGKNLVFDLPSSSVNNDVMLSAFSGVNVSGAHVTLLAQAGVPFLTPGDTVTLIDNTSGTVSNTGEQAVLYGATQYNFEVINNPGDLVARLNAKTVQTNPSTGKANSYAKAYAEGLLAPTLALNGGTDMLVNTGMAQARLAEATGRNLFVTFSGNHTKGNTGSHITSEGYHLMSGATFAMETSAGKLLLAPFAEYGKGNYDTYNSFTGLSVHGSGDTKYWGAGIMSRLDMDSGVYLDSSLRAGRTDSDFSSPNMGWGARYDTRSTYYGAHMGVGYQLDLAQQHHLDTYAKLLWTHQSGDDIITQAREWLTFDAVDSLRTRLGTRYTVDLQDNVQLMLGAAWDYETDGKVNARISGVPIEQPSLKGSTGLLDAGFRWQPTERCEVNLGVFGLVGKREGGGGTVSINYAF